MLARRIISSIVLLIGVGIFIYGTQVSRAAAQGERKLTRAEQNAQDHRTPLIGPVRKSASAAAEENAQKRIGDQKAIVGKTEVSAQWLQGSGIVLFIVGLGSLAFSFRNRR